MLVLNDDVSLLPIGVSIEWSFIMNKRILIIEDDKDITEALRYNLEKEKGFSLLSASNGDEGLNLAFQVNIAEVNSNWFIKLQHSTVQSSPAR